MSASAPAISLEAALEELRPYIVWMLGQYRIPVQDREDVLASAVLAAVPRWGEAREPKKWLIGTLRNSCLQYWRHQRRHPEWTGLDGSVFEEQGGSVCPSPWLRVDLERALSRLRPRKRALFRACYVEGHECGIAAARSGYKPSSGAALLSRCRREVAAHL